MEVLPILQDNWPLATSSFLAVYFFLRTAWLKAKCREQHGMVARLRYEKPEPLEVLVAREFSFGVRAILTNSCESQDIADAIRAFNEGLEVVLKERGSDGTATDTGRDAAVSGLALRGPVGG